MFTFVFVTRHLNFMYKLFFKCKSVIQQLNTLLTESPDRKTDT